MRIDSGLPAQGNFDVERVGQRSVHGSRNAGSSDATSNQRDVVQLNSLDQQALNTPEVRSEKVSALRAQIESGTYKVSGEQLAGAMLSDVLRR